MIYDVIIIGGGASGLVAVKILSAEGKKVFINPMFGEMRKM